MKRIAFVLTLLALIFSPLMVSQADAAPVKHQGITAKHHRKMLKKHARKLAVRKHHRKAA